MAQDEDHAAHSIRHRIMATFAVLMAVMLLAIWAVDNFWLEGYYVGQKQTMMEKAYTDVNQVLMEELEAGKTVSGIIKQELEEEWNVWSKGSSGTEQKASRAFKHDPDLWGAERHHHGADRQLYGEDAVKLWLGDGFSGKEGAGLCAGAG